MSRWHSNVQWHHVAFQNFKCPVATGVNRWRLVAVRSHFGLRLDGRNNPARASNRPGRRIKQATSRDSATRLNIRGLATKLQEKNSYKNEPLPAGREGGASYRGGECVARYNANHPWDQIYAELIISFLCKSLTKNVINSYIKCNLFTLAVATYHTHIVLYAITLQPIGSISPCRYLRLGKRESCIIQQAYIHINYTNDALAGSATTQDGMADGGHTPYIHFWIHLSSSYI
jgi:hypothetical protein